MNQIVVHDAESRSGRYRKPSQYSKFASGPARRKALQDVYAVRRKGKAAAQKASVQTIQAKVEPGNAATAVKNSPVETIKVEPGLVKELIACDGSKVRNEIRDLLGRLKQSSTSDEEFFSTL